MGFVPVSGPATFRAANPPRDGEIEFTDGRRRIALPMRASLPVLARARTDADAHPSVALLAGAALLATRFVAAGKIAPVVDHERPHWRVEGLDERDRESVRLLAAARRYDGLDAEAATALVAEVVDAVADTLPRAAPAAPRTALAGLPGAAEPTAPAGGQAPPAAASDFAARVRQRVAERARAEAAARDAETGLPDLVRISLRVEAEEEELLAGSVRLVLQVHDERDPLHVVEAALLWDEDPDAPARHGFGDRARVHATIALRSAAEAWPVLDRLLALAVPDQIQLDGAEVSGLLEHVGALREAHVDVHWPRSLGADLTTRAVLDRAPQVRDPHAPNRGDELPFQDSPFSAEGLFAFSWQVALHGDPLTEEEMQELATAASPILKLRGAWTVVDPGTAQRARKRLIRRASGAEALGAALTGVVEVPGAGAGPDGETPAAEKVIVGASLLTVRERVLAAATRDPVAVPTGLAAELRDYQRHGLTWLADLTGLGLGACLADDMGLGKTITLISLHLHRLEAGLSGGGPTLVVCPTSLLGNWEAEIARFAPGVPVRRFHGSARSLEDLDAGAGAGMFGAGFVLTTYGTLRSDPEPLAAVGWDLVVADEAQHVKNSRSATARALRRLGSTARVALTGTPVENDLTELWSILDWAIPGLLGSRQAFRRVWAAPIESGHEPTKARQFADLIGPFLLRRRKTDPGIAPELPPKTETDQYVGLTREQVVLYEAFVRDTMERIERADEEARRGLVLALLTGLKQICNHPAQFLKQSGAVRLRGRSEKFELLEELVATVLAEGGGVLVFTQYVALGRLLEAHLTSIGVPHQFLHGGTPIAEREAMVKRFQATPEGEQPPVFLLSLKAGGTGLNLTRADHVIHVDRWWNPAVEEQATDRVYRIGQTKPVQVHKMVTSGTIEERVAQLLTRKRAIADAVLARGDAALTELSNEELRDLVTLRTDQRRAAIVEELREREAATPGAEEGGP
ncbi:DEAD/DEAH box helicase [Nocardioides sp. GY 10113]|uniref:DEAD/DEAH box helicase n=1 Tax=Nocardioides sp. GY 10113 TaxID=2569761 RepID=UPI0010A7ADA6|nr:DEAD/DEAH box helicase [Nocardioides sp. GY 10113]TIC82246.1 DEAD/DEAH box helicase [Nocardioides sp. GY 10113]